MGEVPLYTEKQKNENERRIVMLYSVGVGILVVFFSALLSLNLVQGIKIAQKRYRQTMLAVDRANLAASEIQRLLVSRSLRSRG